MNLSLFLHQYIDFRLNNATSVELYLIDQIQQNQFEILLKDDGKSLEGEELDSAKDKIRKLDLKDPDKYYQYFHKGKNNLQIELETDSVHISFPELNNLIGFMMLQFPDKEFVFTYLSPKGEYLLNSKDFLSHFSEEEIQSKEFALYLNEILYDHLSEVVYSDFG